MSLTGVIGTGNAHKFEELSGLMQHPQVHWRSLKDYAAVPEVVEDGASFEANARKKALCLAQALGQWVLADDSGIAVDALDGRPGIFSARYAGKHGDDEANNDKLLAELKGVPVAQRTARYHCVLALASPQQVEAVAHGTWEGVIAFECRGSGGFGYDPLFYLPEFGRTAGQIPLGLKQKLSHRAAAAAILRRQLAHFLKRQDLLNQRARG
jgi:XTP/dITP diphosphohydrolase